MNSYIKNVVETYIMDPESLNAQEILDYINTKTTKSNTKITWLSKLRSELLLNTTIPGYPNAKEYYTTMRKSGNTYPLVPAEILRLVLSRDEFNERNKLALEQLTHKAGIEVVIKNSNEFLKQITEKLSSNVYRDLYPALLLVSGRRNIEILKTGDFKSIPRKPFMMKFTGQVKGNKEEYIIPCLVKTVLFIKALVRFRKLLNTEGTNAEITQRYHSINEKLFIGLSKLYDVKLTPHSMRSVYIQFAYKIFKIGGETIMGFAHRILGHESIVTQLHYTHIRLI